MLWDETYGFSYLSEKSRKRNRSQMSLQRQHFLLSYLKTLSLGQPMTSRSAERRSPNWANQAKGVSTIHRKAFLVEIKSDLVSYESLFKLRSRVAQKRIRYICDFQDRRGAASYVLAREQNTQPIWFPCRLNGYLCPKYRRKLSLSTQLIKQNLVSNSSLFCKYGAVEFSGNYAVRA